MVKQAIRSSLGLVGLLLSTSALGQGRSDAAGAVATRGDIVVTARKREERIVDVPLAVTAFDGSDLERRGVVHLSDFLQQAPGVGTYDSGDGTAKITIRGISATLGANENGYYLDDLPFSGVTTPITPDVRAWDLERVEVLRGPQGTIFGEGSMGGTVRILTKAADLENWEIKASGLVSNINEGGTNAGFKGAFNVPVIPNVLAVRVAGTRERYAGWLDDAATGRRDINKQRYDTLRAKVRFDPTERLSFQASYWRVNDDFPAGGPIGDENGFASGSGNRPSKLRYTLYGATARYDVDWGELFYGFSHLDLSLPVSGPFAGGTLTVGNEIGNTSHEVRLASNGVSRLKWTIGAYQRSTDRFNPVRFPPLGIDNASTTRSTSHAVFGEATYSLPDAPIDLTAGLRYFQDHLRGVESNAGVVSAQPGDYYHSWNPRFSLAWHPTTSATIYASAAKGFRSGQLQPTLSVTLAATVPGFTLPTALKQDSIWTYELGGKADLLGRTLYLEGAVFYSRWKDQAVRIPIGTTGFNGLINSQGVRSKGVELSLASQPIRGLALSAGGAYVDASYAAMIPGTGIIKGGAADEVPRFTANFSADYRRPFGNGIDGIARVSWQHSSPRRYTVSTSYRAGSTIDRVDARLGLERDRWSFAFFADNLLNEMGAIDARLVTPRAGRDPDISALRLQPRTIGIEASFRFSSKAR
ncbi:Outer membrane receptor proteins, mostly Fe transport [Sphingobium sp. AP50]|uniref:TonB-dependent receptor n=1 Tax=Sphingobium sp. AP50 TaxID=1884369 RepID=UPI0008D41440|nr:TonB-dependent receptor [Sphingobium sp. AP50]SEJ81429.1 Outer membrane receptor proteins, mostly Fe transport [Sphingobium sp. AP50]